MSAAFRHSSIQAREQLDLQWQLGIAPGFKDHNGKAISNAGLFSSAKEVDPEAVALIQVCLHPTIIHQLYHTSAGSRTHFGQRPHQPCLRGAFIFNDYRSYITQAF